MVESTYVWCLHLTVNRAIKGLPKKALVMTAVMSMKKALVMTAVMSMQTAMSRYEVKAVQRRIKMGEIYDLPGMV